VSPEALFRPVGLTAIGFFSFFEGRLVQKAGRHPHSNVYARSEIVSRAKNDKGFQRKLNDGCSELSARPARRNHPASAFAVRRSASIGKSFAIQAQSDNWLAARRRLLERRSLATSCFTV